MATVSQSMTAQEREQLLLDRIIIVLRAKPKDDVVTTLLLLFEAITLVAHTCPSDLDRIASVDFRIAAAQRKTEFIKKVQEVTTGK